MIRKLNACRDVYTASDWIDVSLRVCSSLLQLGGVGWLVDRTFAIIGHQLLASLQHLFDTVVINGEKKCMKNRCRPLDAAPSTQISAVKIIPALKSGSGLGRKYWTSLWEAKKMATRNLKRVRRRNWHQIPDSSLINVVNWNVQKWPEI